MQKKPKGLIEIGHVMGVNTKALLVVLAWLFFCGLFWASTAKAQTKIPCIERNQKGRWGILEDSTCIQYTVAEYKEVVDRLKQLEHYKNTVEPSCLIERVQNKRLALSFAASEKTYKEQGETYVKMLSLQQAETVEWRNQYYRLQRQKIPERSWVEHPALWFTVGVVATLGIVVGSVALFNALKPATNTNTSPLLHLRQNAAMRSFYAIPPQTPQGTFTLYRASSLQRMTVQTFEKRTLLSYP